MDLDIWCILLNSKQPVNSTIKPRNDGSAIEIGNPGFPTWVPWWVKLQELSNVQRFWSQEIGSNLVGCPCSEAKVAQVQTSSCAYMFTAIPCLHRVWTIRLTSLPPMLLMTIVNGKKHYNAFLLEMPLEMKPKHAILLYAIQIMMHRIRFI